MRVKRLEAVEAYIRQVGSVSMQQLCQEFDVSINTIRRDIDTLVQKGQVKKVYGGVVALGKTEENDALVTRELMDFQVRNQECLEEKNRIGRKAAEFVNHGDTIFLDSGSTTLQMVPYLAEKKNLTVVTYSLPALAALAQYPQIRTVALPGVVLGRTASVVGSSTSVHMATIHHACQNPMPRSRNENGARSASPRPVAPWRAPRESWRRAGA